MQPSDIEDLLRRERELLQDLKTIRVALAAADNSGVTPSGETATTFDQTLLYRAILESATDYAIIAASLEGRIVEWNVGARRVLGWSQEQIVGQDIRIIFTPEDREAGVPEREMSTAIEAGHAMDLRWHLRSDGSRFWADGRMMPLKTISGEITGYLKILKDETGLKSSEMQISAHGNVLRTITDTIDTAIIQVDASHHIVFVNPAAERLLGWSAADLHGRSLYDTLCLSPDADEADTKALREVLQTGKVARDVEATFARRDGTPAYLSCSNTPILVDGLVVGAVMAAQDRSARHHADEANRAELRRHEALAEVLRAIEAGAGDLDAIVAAVAHGARKVMPQAMGAAVQMIEDEHCVYRAVADPAFGAVGLRLPLDRSLSGASLELGRPLISDDTECDDRVDHDLCHRYGIRSIIAVPISRHGVFVGVFEATATTPQAFGPRDVLVAQILVGHLSTGFAQVDEARALRNMRQSEERLQLALHASETIGIWDWDVANDLCYADPRFARLFSVDPAAAAAGLPVADYAPGIFPDDRVWIGIAVRKALAEGSDYAIEHRVQLADGSIRWLAARGHCYNGPDGRPSRFPGAVVDITERKRIETSLRTAETNAKLAVRAAGLGLWDYEPAIDVITWDDRCRAIFGLGADVTMSIERLMGHLTPAGRTNLRMIVQNALADGRLADQAHEFEIQRPDGSDDRWIEVSAQAFFTDGRCSRIIGTIGDITDRKRLEAALREDEQRFRSMAETIPQLAWMAAPDGNIFWYNERWFDYTGTTLDEVRGQGWRIAHHPDMVDDVAHRLHACFRDGTPWEDTFLLRGRDGSYRWFLSRAMPIREENGTILRWFGTNTDVDDQIRAREAQVRFGEDLERQVASRTQELSLANARLVAEMADRQRAEDALRQSQKMEAVGQLTGGIAHDFNNLLTGITGSLDLMRKRIAQGRIGELDRYMTAAGTSAQRAAALTHRLLAFARRQPLDAKPVDANALVASMEDLFQRTLGEAIDISLRLSPDLWTTLCDPHQLENALLNLVINARDAMPDGGMLTIETNNIEIDEAEALIDPDRRPGQYVTLQVSDTGMGMEPDVMARIFEPFFTTKPIGQGTGLGLSMIYGFARQSEGHVRVESALGLGTTFTLMVPRFAGASQPNDLASPTSLPATADGETVLVVEDDAVVRALVLDVLRELGYQTLEAPDGMGGLSILQGRARVDLVVTDVGLPGLNGRQLAEMARASRPGLKVLFITGYAENAAFGHGAPDTSMQMITKPFAINDLATKVREMLTQ
ncbi:PAS domain S-box protein [Lichenihabitans sp. PAMC28606]|uniref:PAS domain S-box protein n=1 Tax=Lichenihabitans sp. PAMC28606 TaxID=2880932 RepID=UPI001D0B2181|nr:PAS domain S-box protein [Lichenihabitans sp. PAMC28606]UDL96484.1 PAS domain S-box protein [Lichenihabitans sp. PAMC28606]